MRHRTRSLLVSLTLASAIASAQTTPTALAPPPDLLKEISNRPKLALSNFEGFALNSNPTLRQSRTLVSESASRAAQAALLPNPTVGYQGEHIRGGSYGGGEQGAFIQQDIVLGGKLALRRDIYEQQRRADEIGSAEQRSRVAGGVAQAFYSALAAQETVVVRRHLLDLAFNAVQTAHQLANVGQADAPDVLQAEVEAVQASADYTAAQRQYIAQFHGLSSASGNPALPLSALDGTLENPPAVDAGGIVESILRDSPSLKRAQQDILRAEAEWKAAKREKVPDLQLRGGLEQSGELLAGGLPSGGLPARTVGLQGFATVGVTLPIFNRNQGNVAAAEASLERARAEVSRLQLSLRQTADQLVQTYLTRAAEASLYRDQMIPRATRAYKLYLDKYGQMAAAYPQVLVSQRTLFQLQVGYVSVLENLWTASVALQNYTLAGALNAPASGGSALINVNAPAASRASQ